MKRRVVSVLIAFLTMAITCVGAFADSVTFDKKNKGKEKDFVTFEFNSIDELTELCKKYPKNNAEVLLKADSPLAKASGLSNPEFVKIVDCFPGSKQLDVNEFASLGALNVGLSGISFSKDVSIEFKFDGKKYSLGKISPVEVNTVSFLKVELNDGDYKDQSRIVNKLVTALDKQEENEFNSVKDLETLCKKHKSDSFYIIIPVHSKIRNDKELEKLFKLISDGYSGDQNKFMSYFKSDSSVVIESYVKESQGVNTNGDVLDLVFSLASSAKVHRNVYVFTKADSLVLQVQEAILESERVANEEKGLGKITNAEAEKERSANEVSGKGRLTNAEVLEKQGGGDKSCSVYFFDFELEYKSEWSENFPEGDAKKRMEKALQSRKQYEFNLLTTLKKLCKGHEKESISITIPVGAKMWNERDMMALLEYFYNDTSLAQKYVKDFIMPVISKKQPVVLELYVYGGKLSYASFRTQSVAAQIDVEKEIAANEKAGFGRLTNAEVEKERKQNEAAGRGRLTNAEILSAERDANKKAGLGNLTNAEVEAERSANESAGNGRLTNAELAKKQDEERAANEKAGRGKLTNAEVEKERKANEAAGRGRLTNAEIRTKNKQLFMQKVPKWIANSKISGSEVTISDWFCSPKPTTNVVINYSSNELLLSHEVVTNGFVVFKVDITFRLAKQGDAGNCYISRIYMQNTTTYETQTFVCNGPNDYGNTMEIIGAMSQLLPLMYEF